MLSVFGRTGLPTWRRADRSLGQLDHHGHNAGLASNAANRAARARSGLSSFQLSWKWRARGHLGLFLCCLQSGWHRCLALRLLRLRDLARHLAESRTAHLIWRANLPRPEPQYKVYAGRRLLGIVDFAWPELGVILEFDGNVKYEKYLRDGETASDAVIREKNRENRIVEATGWIVIRVVWADLANPTQLVERIRRAMRRRAA